VKLTEKRLAAIVADPPNTRTAAHDDRVPGFSVRVGHTGAATYYLSYRTREGVRRRYRIGTVKAMTLRDARREAERLLVAIRGGADPASEKRAVRAAKANTLRRYAPGYFTGTQRRKPERELSRFLASWLPLRLAADCSRLL
jgi:hypothetical protein